MGESVADPMSWAMRLGGDEHGRRVFRELLELVPELLAQHFPPSCGYEAHGVRLGGPLEGVRWTITRGSFRGELDVQRYHRAGVDRASPSAMALRVVASAGLREANTTEAETLERRVVGWAMAGWGLGSVALGAVLLGLGGMAPVWAEVLALVPAVAAWRASVACLVRRAGAPTPALPPACEPLALGAPASSEASTVHPPAVLDGLRRWQQLLTALRAQRDRLEAASGRAPFRSPGHLEAVSGAPQAQVHQALAAASSVTWPRPALTAARDASAPARAPRSARAEGTTRTQSR